MVMEKVFVFADFIVKLQSLSCLGGITVDTNRPMTARIPSQCS
jgi:hypothetical protein